MNKLIAQYRGLKKELYVLFFGRLVTAMGSFVWPMLTFFLTTKLGISDGNTTLLLATANILALPAAILGGKLADKYSRKRIIIFFDCATFAFYSLAAILPISYTTAALIFVAALFQTMESPAYDALNADLSASSQRDKAYSLSYLGFNLGYIVGASAAGLLFVNHVRLAFFLNGLAIFISTMLIAFFVKMENAVTADEKELETAYSEYEQPVDEKFSVLQVLADRKVVVWMLLLGCFASLPNNVLGVILPLQLKASMGEQGAAIFGYLNSLNGFVVIAFTPVLTALLRRFTEIPKAAGSLLLFLTGVAFFATDSFVWLLFVGMFIFTLGEVVNVLGTNPYTSRRVPASHRGRVGGIVSVLHTVFGSLTQYMVSFVLIVSNSNYRLVWMIIIGCGLAAVLMYTLLYHPDKKRFPLLYGK